jgi:hypothetical protein
VGGGIAVQVSDDVRVTLSKDQVSCDLAGEAAILNLRSGVYYGLDPIGARVWRLVQEPKTLAELRDLLLAEYDVEAATLEADLRYLLNSLSAQGLIEIQQ